MFTVSETAQELSNRLNEAIDTVIEQGHSMDFHHGPVHDLHSALYDAFKLGDRLEAKQADDLRRYVKRADEAAKVLFDALAHPGRRGTTAARRVAVVLAGEVIEYLDLLVGGVRKSRARRKRTVLERPLTTREVQALELYAQHGGKLSEVARALGVKHPTAHALLKAAWGKMPGLAPGKAKRPGRTRRLPTSRRGQVDV